MKTSTQNISSPCNSFLGEVMIVSNSIVNLPSVSILLGINIILVLLGIIILG
ncbi:MAG: hypothetical protein Q8T08_21035 [Ignavibacteria bacterium]|nr:hypothetical protein [Ignavibacteria bacterium]